MKFSELGLVEPILRALQVQGYETPTPIQSQAIPPVLAGHDVLGCAQTGTGKTAAFALPMIQRLMQNKVKGQFHPVRGLVLAPTRELAAQIGENIAAYAGQSGLRHTVVFGGVGFGNQINALKNGVDILVATPGRLLDLINRGCTDLKRVEIFTLDEADRMLDMGFIHDIRRVIAMLPVNPRPQTLLFSATMPGEIRKLVSTIQRNPVNIQVAPVATPAEKIAQSVYFVDRQNKSTLLCHLLQNTSYRRAIIFTRTKRGADHVATRLNRAGIRAEAIHGNKSQNARTRAMDQFRSGKTPVLVASDIASRGIDVDEISHVVNYDMPNEPETYVHRIGRTARAGASGQAISFCDREERSYLKAIERLMKVQVTVCEDHPDYKALTPTPMQQAVQSMTQSHAQSHAQPKPQMKPRTESRPPSQSQPHWRAKKQQQRPHHRGGNKPMAMASSRG